MSEAPQSTERDATRLSGNACRTDKSRSSKNQAEFLLLADSVSLGFILRANLSLTCYYTCA